MDVRNTDPNKKRLAKIIFFTALTVGTILFIAFFPPFLENSYFERIIPYESSSEGFNANDSGWSMSLEPNDLDQTVTVVFTTGNQSSGGFRFEVEKVTIQRGVVKIYTRFTEPEGPATMAITSYYLKVIFSTQALHGDMKVIWILNGKELQDKTITIANTWARETAFAGQVNTNETASPMKSTEKTGILSYPVYSPLIETGIDPSTQLPESAYAPPPTETPYIGPTLTPTFTPAPRYIPNVTLTAATLTGSFRLPAPLYFLYPPEWDNPDTQVWRLEQDGQTRTQITHELMRVRELDVAHDGRLAYISDNDLIVTDASGGNRQVLIAGGVYPEVKSDSDTPNFLKNAINNPIWSPDGQSLAIGWNGVKIINLSTGEQIQVSPENEYKNRITSFNPIAWSPTGNRVVIWIGYYEGGSIGIAQPEANSKVFLPKKPEADPFDSEFSFLPGGQLLFGNNNQYMQTPDATALWIFDPQAMSESPEVAVQKTIKPVKAGEIDILYSPKLMANGRIYFFFNPVILDEKTFAQLAWVDPSLTDENREIHPVGSFGIDPNILSNLLWAPDGSIAILPIYQEKLVVIRTSDGAAFTLDVLSGANLKWGKNNP